MEIDCVEKELTEIQKNVLIGSLLGDGHLELVNHGKNACLKIGRTLADKEYLLWQGSIFNNFLTPRGIKDGSVYDKRTQKTYFHTRLSTICHPIFTEFHKKWYINKRKIVPLDIVLNPMILAVWLADDGHIAPYKCNKKKSNTFGKVYPNVLHIKLATHSFSSVEVEFLRESIEKLSGAKGKIYAESNGQETIRYFKDDSFKILRVVDSVFPPLERKSMVWRKNGVDIWKNKDIYICPHCFCDRVYKNGSSKTVDLLKKTKIHLFKL